MSIAGSAAEGVIYRPRSAVFWVFVLALCVGTLGVLQNLAPALQVTLTAHLLLIPPWIAFVAVLIRVLMLFDPYRSMRGYPQVLCAAAALGATTALFMALIGNEGVSHILAALVPPDFADSWHAALSAPLIEETSKAACGAVILVLCARRMNRIAHALMIGMFVGLGFDLAEDLTYQAGQALNSLDSDLAGAAASMVMRALTAIPSHWAYTALATTGVLLLLPSYAEGDRWLAPRRVATALGLFFCAWLMHFVWNSPVPAVVEESTALSLAVLFLKIGFNLTLFLVVAARLLREEQGVVRARITELCRAGGPLSRVSPQLLAALATRRSQRAFLKAARRSGGRAAARSAALRQRFALDLVQSSDA